jgi:hypothetical protein
MPFAERVRIEREPKFHDVSHAPVKLIVLSNLRKTYNNSYVGHLVFLGRFFFASQSYEPRKSR